MSKQPCSHPLDASEALSTQRRQPGGKYRNLSAGRYCWACRTFFLNPDLAPKGEAA